MIQYISDWLARHSSHQRIGWLYRNVPAALLDNLRMHRFRKVVRWAGQNSPFYRRAFAERGIDPTRVNKPSDLGDFFTTPDDIVRNASEFLCKPPFIVFESSGTSGKNKQVYFGKEEMSEMGRVMAAGFEMLGMTPQDRIANAFDFSIWIPGLLAHSGLSALGCFTQAFGKVDPIEVYRRLDEYKFTIVLGEPTWLIRLTELAEQHGSYPLKLLVGGAEEMPADAVAWMERVWSPAKVKMCYGSVEMGSSLGFQPCDRRDGYHIDDMNFLVETIDADADQYGELVLTTLRRRVMPLIRYRTRDVTKLETAACPCGYRAPRIARLRGRRDELIVASGGNLYPLMFEQIIRAVPELGRDWQVVFSLEGVREIMEIKVECETLDQDQITHAIKEQIAEQYPDLAKNHALGIFEMRITCHAPGTIRSGRKLRRLIDRRHFSADQPVAQDESPVEESIAG